MLDTAAQIARGRTVRALLEHGSDVVALFDGEGRLLYVSPGARQMLGTSGRRFLGQPLVALVHPQYRARAREVLARCRAHPGTAVRAELRVAHEQGGFRDLEVVLTDHRGDPRVAAIVANVTDVSEQRRAEERYRVLFDLAPDATVVCEADGRITLANRQAQSLFGYSHDELTGVRIEALLGVHASSLLPDGAAAHRLHARRKDGAVFPVAVRIGPSELRDEGRMMVSIRDVSAEERMERAMRERERQLSEAQRISHVGGWSVDLKRGVAVWSDEARRIHGVDLHEWTPGFEEWLACVHPDDRDRSRAAALEALQRGGPFELIHRIVRPDGVERVVHGRNEVILDEHGAPSEMFGTSHDVTEQARLEHSLREREEALERKRRELEQIIDRIPDGILLRRGEQILYANPALAQSLGFAQAELAHKRLPELVHPDDRAAVAALAAGGGNTSDECRFVRADGEVATFSVRHVGEVELGGEPSCMNVLCDLTAHKQLQAQLFVADRMAAVGTLAAGVAHEINNPLAAVIANLDVATRELGALPDGGSSLRELAAELGEARQAAERVRSIASDLRLFARGEDAASGVVDVHRMLDSVLRMAWNETRHRARLVKDYASTSLWVTGSESRLAQVFLNLVVNAGQAIAEGAVDDNEIRVTTRTTADGRVSIEVRDSGCGIPPQLMKRLFAPFVTSKPVGVGTGLGLWISRGIVNAAGGEMSVESVVDRGSVFCVVLRAAERPDEAPAPRALDGAARTTRRGRVLVVDDEASLANAIRRTLAGDHEVTTLTSAAEALARIAGGERFDVILCDMMMPTMTGMDLYLALEHAAPDQAARMIFLTGGAVTDGARAFLESFAHRRRDKPFDGAVLRAVVGERVG